VKLSVALSQRLGARSVEYAQRAERLGFDGVYVFDHLIPVGRKFDDTTESVGLLGTLAATVPRLTIGSLVLRASLRPPQVTASIARTLAAIAPGRIVLGLGAGDQRSRDEMVRFGFAFNPVAERVEVLATILELVAAEDVRTLVGGQHPLVVDVAAKADVWNLWEPQDDVLDAAVSIHPSVTWAGRVEVSSVLNGTLVRDLRKLTKSGCREAVLTLLPGTELETLETVASELR